MKYFVFFLLLTGFMVLFTQNAFASCISLPCDDANVMLGAPNYRFIDFSYQNKVGEPITFILEKTSIYNCNSYIATITNEDDKVVWTQNKDYQCTTSKSSESMTSQIKLGYENDNPIVMPESSKYYLKVQVDDGSVQREFVARENFSGISLDRTAYPAHWNSKSQIENINGSLFRIIGPFTLRVQSNDTIHFGNVEFSYPHYPVPTPPGGVQSVSILFQDGVKENIGTVGHPNPFLKFTDHENPKAGVRRNSDGTFDYLLSIANQSVSPLRQFALGIPIDQIQCKEGLDLILKSSDISPTCVKPETKQKLIERGWTKSEHLSRLVEPEHIPDPVCFVIETATSGEKGGAMSSTACFPLSDFESLGCDGPILEYIYKYTNLLEGEFDGTYVRNMVGLPEGVSEKEYEKCANSIYEKRKSMSENMEFESFSIVEGTKVQLEGVIMDVRLGPDHRYSFFTNDSHYSFNTGSEGITLEGINNENDLHGKIVTLSGIRTQRDLGIKVDDIVVTGSLIPSSNASNPVLAANDILDVSLDSLYANPDQYYNRFVRVAGKLSEYETDIAYAGVGCNTAKYAASDEFVSDFPSSRHLQDGGKSIGVRIETPDDLGRVTEPLPNELKTNKVTVMGIFVPNIVERGECDHVIHKSGFLLTKLEDIKIDGGCVKTTFPDGSGMVVCD